MTYKVNAGNQSLRFWHTIIALGSRSFQFQYMAYPHNFKPETMKKIFSTFKAEVRQPTEEDQKELQQMLMLTRQLMQQQANLSE